MGGVRRILVVDDEQQNRDLLEALLASMEYESEMAQDGFEALAMLRPGLDLVLLDVMLPGIDGFEVARRIRQDPQCGDVPIIMVTALSGKQDRLAAVEAGANDFVTKPIDRVELRVRMASLLKMKDAQDAIKRHRAELESTVKKRTAALRESEERMRLLIEASPIGIILVQHGGYTYANPAVVKMFRYENSNEIVGQDQEALFAADDRDRFDSWATEALSGSQEILGKEIRGLRKTGESLDLSIWLTSTNLGDEPALLGFLIDVSEEKSLKAQLLHAQKMEALGTLAGGIAHDFNNILFVITGYTELAMDEQDQTSRAYQDLQKVVQAADRAKYMVQQILTFSRQSEQEKKPIDITPIIRETVKFLRGSIPSTVVIKDRILTSPGTILADPTQIHQVLMNLCTNAAHAMRDAAGVLTVELDSVELDSEFVSIRDGIAPGRFVRISVTDTGNGMTPEVMGRIFEPYFTTKKQGEGTGLGLAVVHGIVKSHGGALTVESELGKGSRFQAYFPVIPEEIPQEDTDAEVACGGTERILFVDDEDNVSWIGKRILEKLGYKVVISNGSSDALRIFRADPEQFDLVITDMTMPHLTGIELATEIKKLRADIPIILCTGFSELDERKEVAGDSVDAFVLKPVSRNKLASAVRSVLERSDERKC